MEAAGTPEDNKTASNILSKKVVELVQAQGKVCVLEIEIQGVEQIRDSDLNPLLVFINPPSIEELERRLRGCKTETEESLQKRLTTAKHEIKYGQKPGNFHIVINNYNVKKAYKELRDFIVKELGKNYKNKVVYRGSCSVVELVQAQGKVCVLEIEIQGVEQIRDSDLNPLLVFINPPSIEELERRLRGCKTETEESLQKRLTTAKHEIKYGQKPGNFHIVINNYNVKKAYKELRDFIVKELETQQNEGINVILNRCEVPQSP